MLTLVINSTRNHRYKYIYITIKSYFYIYSELFVEGLISIVFIYFVGGVLRDMTLLVTWQVPDKIQKHTYHSRAPKLTLFFLFSVWTWFFFLRPVNLIFVINYILSMQTIHKAKPSKTNRRSKYT
jgi:hypothetical protein